MNHQHTCCGSCTKETEGYVSVLTECKSALFRADVLLTLGNDLILRIPPSDSRHRALSVLDEVKSILQDASGEILSTGLEL